MARRKLINCKVCGAEVAKSARTCPRCGSRVKKKHPILTVVLILIVVGVVFGSSDDKDVKKAEPLPQSTETVSQSAPVNEIFHVGETALVKDVAVTLVNVTESTGSEFNQPTAGNIFVLCEFEIANNSSKEINVSSAMSFEAYCDDYTCNFSLGALMEKGGKNQLDGTVAAGKKFNGIIGYEVPIGWQALEVRFTPDFWSGKDVTFVAENGGAGAVAAKPEQTVTEQKAEAAPAGTDGYPVGQMAELKGVCVTLVGVTESTGSEYNTPTAGNVFVLCEFEIANNSSQDISVSSAMSFEAYCDDYTCTFSLGALMEKGNKNQLDGTVAAGKKFNGVIGYEVPASWKELEVRFTPDFWSGKDLTFVAFNQ